MRWVGMLSGGLGSAAACKLAAQKYGPENGVLLFADTLKEDADLYRFLPEAAAWVGSPLVRVADGRTPFEVFRDQRYLVGRRQFAWCSVRLKVEPCRRWLEAERDPADTVLVVGIGWSEAHRVPAIEANWEPWRVECPLCEPPYLTAPEIADWLRQDGVKSPATYAQGWNHNNCLEQGCVKGGQAYWRHLLRTRPEVYARTEAEEEALRRHLGKDVAILRDRRGGKTVPLPLAEFRRRVEGDGQCDLFEWGGCGCFTDAEGLEDAGTSE